MHARLIVGTVFLVLSLSRPVAADVIVFTSESAFLAAAGTLAFEGFEETEPGETGSSRFLDGFILSDPGFFGSLQIVNDPTVAAEGSQAVAGGSAMDFIAFDVAPTAFGFTLFGFGDEGPNSLTLFLDLLGGVNLATIPLASSTDPFSPFRFFGVISTTPFNTVRIRLDSLDDSVALDAVHFGRAIPEPGTGLLLGGAVCALLARRAHQRSARATPRL